MTNFIGAEDVEVVGVEGDKPPQQPVNQMPAHSMMVGTAEEDPDE